jgi:hypothetical protein
MIKYLLSLLVIPLVWIAGYAIGALTRLLDDQKHKTNQSAVV